MTTVQFIQSVLVSGLATTLATEALKSPLIPVPATKYPRITAAVVSLGASVVALLQSGFDFNSMATDWPSLVALFTGVLLIASVTYNQVIKQR